ncbi:MAG: SMC-Scp complex subunit ScpB [Thermoanaerobaculales bacterium]|nr:SMC-Scp complex subunit ScpB [Thermoanaerobaculales bacterium]
MSPETLRALIEAIVLTARDPVEAAAITMATEGEVDEAEVEQAFTDLASSWDADDRGVRLERSGGGWRCVTDPRFDHTLRTFHGITSRQKLSQAALEVLAIIAHRQPVTLPEINFIRGANSSAVTRTLLDRRLIRLAGRKKVVGKPFLYRTTREFLLHFGLDRAEDLPDPEELVEAEAAAEL